MLLTPNQVILVSRMHLNTSMTYIYCLNFLSSNSAKYSVRYMYIYFASFNPLKDLLGGSVLDSHFADEEAEAQR